MRKVRKAMIIFVSILLGAVILITGTIGAIRLINCNKAEINTSNGIQDNVYVKIGGIKQYMQIRGEDMNNPVILWLHGGMGFHITYLTPYYQTALESDYTIVCWEQRGCGRTYTDATNNKAYTGTYKMTEETSKSATYEIDGIAGNATIAITEHLGNILTPTLPINFGEYTVYFLPNESTAN